MEDKQFRRMIVFFVILLLFSPFFYHEFYNHTRKDRLIDEINRDFKIAYFYPDAMFAYTEGGGKDGKDKISIMDYAHINQDGIHRLENQSSGADYKKLKISEYLARFEGKEGYDEVKIRTRQMMALSPECRIVERNGRQMILLFERSDKQAIFFNCKIDN